METKEKRIVTKNFAGLCLLSIVACSNAKTASEVSASYVPTARYQKMPCSQLRSEERRAQQQLNNKVTEKEKSYRDDKTAEVVAWILFAPALLLMDRNSDEQRQLGEAKGTVTAIQDSMDAKGC